MKKIIVNLLLIIGLQFNLIAQEQLEYYVDIALNSHPELKSNQLKTERLEEQKKEQLALKNTQVSFGYFAQSPETRLGPQQLKLGVKQALPWFGTQKRKADLANANVNLSKVEQNIKRKEIRLEVSLLYTEIIALNKTRLQLNEELDYLNQSLKLIERNLETGLNSALDLIKKQISKQDLEQKIEINTLEFQLAKRQFNLLLSPDKSTNLSDSEFETFDFQNFGLNIKKLNQNSDIQLIEKQIEKVNELEKLNQKSKFAQFTLGLDYVLVNQRPDQIPQNGRDILMPNIGFSVPILNKSYNSKSKQNELAIEEFEFQKQTKLLKLETALNQTVTKREKALKTIETLDKHLEKSNQIDQLLKQDYETNLIDFQTLLDWKIQKSKWKLERIEAQKIVFEQTYIINYLQH
ncbi:MAG: TolC family protein [Flavobacteriales bacterium]